MPGVNAMRMSSRDPGVLPRILETMNDVPYRGRAFVYVLPMAGPEDLLKVGLTHDPLARWSAFHPRWFEVFDIDQALLLATESRKEAQRLETRLRKELAEWNCPAPLTIRVRAGGRREWHRGAFAACRAFIRDRELEGYFVPPSTRQVLADGMAELAAKTASLLQQGLADLQAGTLGDAQLRALGDLVDAHRAFGTGASLEALDLETEWLRGRHG